MNPRPRQPRACLLRLWERNERLALRKGLGATVRSLHVLVELSDRRSPRLGEDRGSASGEPSGSRRAVHTHSPPQPQGFGAPDPSRGWEGGAEMARLDVMEVMCVGGGAGGGG